MRVSERRGCDVAGSTKRLLTFAAVVALAGATSTAAAPTAAEIDSATGEPVIGKPTAVPKQPQVGKRFTVSFRVTQGNSRRPVLRAKMACVPSVSGKAIPHRESFRRGTARVWFVVPAVAEGKLLRVRVNVKVGRRSATRVVSFRVPRLPLPKLSIADAAIPEGSAGTRTISFPVTLSAASSKKVTVSYATSDGTASAPADYEAAKGTLTFRPGERAKTIVIAVVADTAIEEDETFRVSLASPVNAVLADRTATGTITNDDVVVPVAAGAYAGATQEGNPVLFTVQSDRTLTGFSVNTLSFDCVPRVELEQQLRGQMSIIANYWFRELVLAIEDGGSFDGSFTRSSAGLRDIDSLTATARVTGRFGTPTTATGTVLMTLDLTYKGTHLACSSGQKPWTASLQG